MKYEKLSFGERFDLSCLVYNSRYVLYIKVLVFNELLSILVGSLINKCASEKMSIQDIIL